MSAATAPSFENDIEPLFRASDRAATLRLFDLWSFDRVRDNAGRILAAARAGSMPCDARRSSEQVDLFARWIEGGRPQ